MDFDINSLMQQAQAMQEKQPLQPRLGLSAERLLLQGLPGTEELPHRPKPEEQVRHPGCREQRQAGQVRP